MPAGVKVKGVTYTNIVTTHDELVSPYTSGIEPGMTNITVQDHCATDYTEHFEIAADPVAAGYVLNALDPAHPRPVPCTIVLPFEGPCPPGAEPAQSSSGFCASSGSLKVTSTSSKPLKRWALAWSV